MTSSEPNSTASNAELNDSVWQYKPWWCQPWSIILTTATGIGGSWQLFHRFWVTGLVALPLLAWMGFFLLAFPRLARESGMLAEMRQAHLAQSSEAKL